MSFLLYDLITGASGKDPIANAANPGSGDADPNNLPIKKFFELSYDAVKYVALTLGFPFDDFINLLKIVGIGFLVVLFFPLIVGVISGVVTLINLI